MATLMLDGFLRALGITLDPKTTKLVRHQDSRYDIPRLIAANQLEIYQANQGKHIFQRCTSFLSFSADGGSRSELIGLYRVNGVSIEPGRGWPAHFLYQDEPGGSHWYDLVRDPVLAEYERRLVIDWGSATRAWHQWHDPVDDKQVIEIKAKGRHSAFPGYGDVVLSYDELRRIVTNPAANLDWKYALSKVSGVYLIHDMDSGDLYIGSAYGHDGIWGRWSCYVDSCHGNNVRLMDLCQRHPGRHQRFRFSILKTMAISDDRDAVLAQEIIWKTKLGTRAFGLNGN